MEGWVELKGVELVGLAFVEVEMRWGRVSRVAWSGVEWGGVVWHGVAWSGVE